MTYATLQNLIDRFGYNELTQLTDRDNLGEINLTVINQSLTDADAEINPYLASRYALPLSGTPLELSRIACNIARYNLYADVAPDQVVSRYKSAIRFLENVSSGKADLGLDAANAPSPTENTVQFNTTPHVFARDSESYE